MSMKVHHFVVTLAGRETDLMTMLFTPTQGIEWRADSAGPVKDLYGFKVEPVFVEDDES